MSWILFLMAGVSLIVWFRLVNFVSADEDGWPLMHETFSGRFPVLPYLADTMSGSDFTFHVLRGLFDQPEYPVLCRLNFFIVQLVAGPHKPRASSHRGQTRVRHITGAWIPMTDTKPVWQTPKAYEDFELAYSLSAMRATWITDLREEME